MQTNELAAKYGVVTYETSMQLNWQYPTNFYWCKNQKGELLVLTLKEVNILCNIHGNENYVIVLCEAPQIHEILSEVYKERKFDINLVGMRVIFDDYSITPFKRFDDVVIENNNFAEGFAKMYLKLKQECAILQNQ